MNLGDEHPAAIVTGGAGGIGQAVLVRLAQDGFRPVSWDSAGAPPVDVTDSDALEHAAAAAGTVGALVVNAGILGPVLPAWQASPADVRRVMEVNLVSAFLTVRAVVPRMLANPGQDRGRIVIVSSVQAKEGTALSGPYAASKAGLIALAKVLGKELAGDGILVNAIAPTVVRTEMERSITPERRADLLARIPLGRFIEPGEVAAMVSFLCSPACSASTGAVFDLSGGRATW